MQGTWNSRASAAGRFGSLSLQYMLWALLMASLAPSTKRSYRITLIQLCMFGFAGICTYRCLLQPVSVCQLSHFIAHLAQSGLSYATVVSKLSAISFWHNTHAWKTPVRSSRVLKVLQGVHHMSPVGLPVITLSILHLFLQRLAHLDLSPNDQHLIAAMFSLTFDTFLRISEMTSFPHALYLFDCQILHSALLITFRSFKFSCGRVPLILIPWAHWDICAVTCLENYLAVRPCASLPHLFVDAGGQSISAWHFTQFLHVVSSASGFSHAHFSPHCFRIGAATIVAALGVPSDVIQCIEHWSSPTFHHYIRLQINHF